MFAVLLSAALSVSLFFIRDKASSENILAALPFKHKHLDSMANGKILFVGGSNLSFGLDSKRIEDSLKRPVYNMGLHAGMGLEFIANDVLPYVKKNDLIVLAPEYENFHTDNFYGEMELVSVLFDVLPESRKSIAFKQWSRLLKYMPVYSAKKIKNFVPSLLQKTDSNAEVNIYDRRSFNSHGDAYIHWNLPNQDFLSLTRPVKANSLIPEVIPFLKNYNDILKSKGASLILLPPVIEKQSYNNQSEIINIINLSLKKEELGYSVPTENYCYDRGYFFNSYYHLNKTGVDKRTLQIITDLKKYFKEIE